MWNIVELAIYQKIEIANDDNFFWMAQMDSWASGDKDTYLLQKMMTIQLDGSKIFFGVQLIVHLFIFIRWVLIVRL